MPVQKYIEAPVPVEEALARLKRVVKPVSETEVVHTASGYGRVLAEDVVAEYDFPPRPRAAYDGYAVRSSDTPGRLRVIGEATIGKVDVGVRLEPGTAVYVSTGAYLPEGADAVVPEEAVKVENDYIIIESKYERWKNVDPPGFYVRRGQKLLEKGYVLTFLDVVGLLDVGVTKVKVYRQVNIALLVTGSELFEPTDPDIDAKRILRGEVAETTGKLIEWLINRYTPWARVISRNLVPDNVETIQWLIERQFTRADLVIMTGGTGPSTVDTFYQLASKLNASIVFRGLRVRGGRPTSAAVLEDGKVLLALSGHPISALHGFLRLVYPLLRYMGNVVVASEPPTTVYAALEEPLRSRRVEPLKVTLRLENGIVYARPLPRERQLSSVIVSNTEADGIALVEVRDYVAGDRVPVMVYREPSGRSAKTSS